MLARMAVVVAAAQPLHFFFSGFSRHCRDMSMRLRIGLKVKAPKRLANAGT